MRLIIRQDVKIYSKNSGKKQSEFVSIAVATFAEVFFSFFFFFLFFFFFKCLDRMPECSGIWNFLELPDSLHMRITLLTDLTE